MDKKIDLLKTKKKQMWITIGNSKTQHPNLIIMTGQQGTE